MMSDISRVNILVKRDVDILGDRDRRSIELGTDGTVSIKEYNSGKTDEFCAPVIESIYSSSADLVSLKRAVSGSEMSSGDIEITIGYDDGSMSTYYAGAGTRLSAEIEDIVGRGTLEFDMSGSSGIRFGSFSKEKLDELFNEGRISEDVYRNAVGKISEFNERKVFVDSALSDTTYPFVVSPVELKSDHNNGFLTDDLYNDFVWYIRESKDVQSNDRSEEFISMKIKFSVWGQRLLGRYDTFEFFLDREDCELIDRRYSVHGTLFEGCGNYKAPDAAVHTAFTKERTHEIFRYLGLLNDAGILSKDHSENKFDCAFFDLYTRMEDGTSAHTKGTSDYPFFVRMLMYLLGQEIRYIC